MKRAATALLLIISLLGGCIWDCGRAQIGEAQWADKDAYERIPQPGERNGYEIEWVTPENDSLPSYKVIRQVQRDHAVDLRATSGEPVRFTIETDDDPMNSDDAYGQVTALYSAIGLGPPPSQSAVTFTWTKIPCG